MLDLYLKYHSNKQKLFKTRIKSNSVAKLVTLFCVKVLT